MIAPSAILAEPAAAMAWRQARPAEAAAVALVAGTFDILHPGNLAALLNARALGAAVVALVEASPAAPSAAARGGPAYSLEDRLAGLTFLKPVDAVAAIRPPHAERLLAALSPYTWVGRPFDDDGPLPAAVLQHAAVRFPLPLLRGCRTSAILEAARAGRVPVALPSAFPAGPAAAAPRLPPAATVNGCFDVLHIGHARFLAAAAALAKAPLTLLINSDASIRRYKGPGRPVFPLAFRRAALQAMRPVADALPFDDDEPLALLAALRPALHIKGGSRDPARVRREEELLARWGGRVAFCPLLEGYSTSAYLAAAGIQGEPP